MKTINELVNQDDPRQSIGYESQTNAPELNDKQQQFLEEIWGHLAGIFGYSLVNQYGEVMPEAWVMLLKGITPRQITDGVNRIAIEWSSDFPPNGAQFRDLCLGIKRDKDGNDISLQHKSVAHIAFDDPRHPEYKFYRPRIESDDMKNKRLEARNKAMMEMGDL